MASETEFEFITLQEAEPDDEVIFAGISSASVSFAESENNKSQKESSSKESDSKEAPRSSRGDGEYPETTLEDLQDIKMPFAQKLVILFAIVLIIVAIIYYLLVLK